MKYLFKTLPASLFLVVVSITALNAQVIEVFESNGPNSYSNSNIKGSEINILAGDVINLKIKISEVNKYDFKTDTADFNLIIPDVLSYKDVYEITNNTYPNSSSDIEFTNASLDFYNDPTNNKDYLSNELKVKGEAVKDSIVIKKLKIQIPNNISTGNYALQLEHRFNGNTYQIETLLTFHYQKPVIGVVKAASASADVLVRDVFFPHKA